MTRVILGRGPIWGVGGDEIEIGTMSVMIEVERHGNFQLLRDFSHLLAQLNIAYCHLPPRNTSQPRISAGK